jgi:hypothetical protein
MHSFHAWRDGIRRVASAPAIVAIVWIATTVVSVPLTFTIRGDIERSLDGSVAATAAARGVDYEWMQEFADRATGVASTFRPTIIGFAAVLDNLSAYVDNVRRPTAIAAAALVYVLLWTFLTGGVIDRYANDRPATHLGEFVRACGRYVFRFVRLEIATAVAYAVLFGVLHRWMFGNIYPRLIEGVVMERTAFAIRASLYLIFVALLAAVNLVFDFAKVRAVVEDRRSMLVALAASWRFVRRRTSAAIGVYLLDALTFALVLTMYSYVAPPGGGTGPMAWAAVLIGQAYVIGRLSVRLLFFASEIALFQGRDH